MIVVCGLTYLYTSNLAVASYESKIAVNYPFDDEFRLNSQNKFVISGYALGAGILAGLAGIGGGTIMSPLLLEYGLKPRAASITSSLTVVCTSFISLMVALLGGHIHLDQIWWFYALATLGSVVISSFLTYCVRILKRQSIIMGILVLVVGASLIVICVFTGRQILDDPSYALHFRSIC
jgi:uncharacterized membrane protein YfcA